MSARKAPFYLYEGRKTKDRHIRLTKDMLTHKRYLALSSSAKTLYQYMKLWGRGEKEFEYSWRLASNLFGSNVTYINARNQLINEGFIESTFTCYGEFKPKKYRFSSKWHSEDK